MAHTRKLINVKIDELEGLAQSWNKFQPYGKASSVMFDGPDVLVVLTPTGQEIHYIGG